MGVQRGSLLPDLLEEGTLVDWPLKVGLKLKRYFKWEALAPRDQSPCWLESGGAAGEGAGAATGAMGGLERWAEVKVGSRRVGCIRPLEVTKAEAPADSCEGGSFSTGGGGGGGVWGPAVCTVVL